MSNTENTSTAMTVEQAVADFDQNFKKPTAAAIKGIDKEIGDLQIKSRDHTYDMVAALVDLAELLDVENPTEEYQSFLVSRAISKPAKGHNAYMAFIKAVFSVKSNGIWTFGTEQRSFEKHANHVRFLVNARRKGLITGTVQDYIKSYTGMLKGIEAQDRIDNPNAAQAKRVQAARDAGRTAAARATITETFSGKEGDVVKLYGRIRQGVLEVLDGKVVSNDDEKERIFYSIGSAKK
jgi:hypothetical protein